MTQIAEQTCGLLHRSNTFVFLELSSVWNHLRDRKCPVQTTDWSQCSRSCGMGVSSRITNKNPQCKLERETRICTVRPCDNLTFPTKVN